MTPGLVDCHAHLEHFDIPSEDLEEYLARSGIDSILSAGTDLASSRASLELAARSSKVLGAVGLHPWQVARGWPIAETRNAFDALASDPRCVAISEVGLDTAACDVPLDLQKQALSWFIELAQRNSLPMVLHLQVPVATLLEVWSSVDGRMPRAAIHGFYGDAADAQLLLENGFVLSLGTVTTGLMAGGPPVADDVIRLIPDGSLLLDSDAYVPKALADTPSLTSDLRGWLKEAGPLEVGSLRSVAEYIARVRGVSVEEIAAIVSRNFTSFIGK
nr:TatD family hydrolase [Rhodococcus sp. (in: high G+C Gram-positive bacteria)]